MTPGSSTHGILQARILEWVAISYSRESFQLRDWTQASCIAGSFSTIWATTVYAERGQRCSQALCWKDSPYSWVYLLPVCFLNCELLRGQLWLFILVILEFGLMFLLYKNLINVPWMNTFSRSWKKAELIPKVSPFLYAFPLIFKAT